MSDKIIRCVGFDCGNSSVRTVLGTFDGDNLDIEVISQVPNYTVRAGGYDYWDILYLFEQMQQGLKKAVTAAGGAVDSAGISTWGIDFGLFGPSGQLLSNPLCYRNTLGSKGLETLDSSERKKMFDISGIQNHPMNSVYQLAGIRDYLPEYYNLAEKLLFTPDLLNFFFTGEWNTESTIASTSQLLNMKTLEFDDALFDTAGIKKGIMPTLVGHGKVRGNLMNELAEKLDIPVFPFISIPGHDTASAVVTVPAAGGSFAFISSGTWSLVGTELAAPVINDDVYRYELANEGGCCNTVTLLKNSAGMNILQKIKKELEMQKNRSYSWDEIVDLSVKGDALESVSEITLFDPNHEDLYNPDSMIRALKALTGESDISRILAGVYISLACNYRRTIHDIEKTVEHEFPVIHIIGGGSKNNYLNQLTADISEKAVVAGPDEATSLGTVAVQLLYHYPDLDLLKIREIISKSVNPVHFEKIRDRSCYYRRYEKMLEKV